MILCGASNRVLTNAGLVMAYVRYIVPATIAVGHAWWVYSCVLPLPEVLARGYHAYEIWAPFCVIDAPVVILWIGICYFLPDSVGDFFWVAYTLPYWLFLVGGSLQWGLLAWLPFRFVDRRRRRAAEARRIRGQCVSCGYDLTGNRSGRCPECGTAVSYREIRASDADGCHGRD